jgi:hypothetical protein
MAEDAKRTKSLQSASELTESQLEHAIRIARKAGFESEPVIVAAVLQAIVANHWQYMR